MTADATSTAKRPVVTRFAPSPTGYLHIGGARTALFNWLFARHHGGKYLLRIEDTDRARSTDAAIDAIIDGLEWLGLASDEPAVFQFDRAARHAEVAQALLEAGHAYRCYATAEELAALREQQRAAKVPMRYDGRWRDRAPEDAPAGAPYVVRLKAPRTGETVIEDAVQGHVVVQNAELDDMVLLRSDGSPTYMLAVVVDDHDMGVTHVIRGDDHLNNAFRQLAIIRALSQIEGGWEEPSYAHMPMIYGADGSKLSKRHGAMGVDAYRDEMGMLPEAMVNYLLRLGWGHGDEEIIDRDRAIALFDIDGVGRSPSRFDIKKLESVNAHYIREADDARLAALVAPRMGQDSAEALALLTAAMPSLKPRAKTLNELAEGAGFLFAQRPLDFDDKARALLDGDAQALLAKTGEALTRIGSWTPETIEAEVRVVAEDAGIGLGKVAQPLRAALTGRTTSPGIFDVLFLIGKDETLLRLADARALAVV